MSKFKFQGKSVYYKIYGTGTPLLMIHGNTVSSKMFKSILKIYVQEYQVILIDLPGHGKSERLSNFETDFWYYNSKACYALIQELSLEKVAVIGSSGGALVALNLALEHPEKILWLVADSFEGEYPLDSYIKTLKEDRENDKKKLLAKLFWYYNHGFDWKKIVNQDTNVNIAFSKTRQSFFHKSLANLSVKTLLTGSLQDEYCDHIDQILNDLKKQNNHFKLHIFPEGKHPAILTNKHEFFKLIKKEFD